MTDRQELLADVVYLLPVNPRHQKRPRRLRVITRRVVDRFTECLGYPPAFVGQIRRYARPWPLPDPFILIGPVCLGPVMPWDVERVTRILGVPPAAITRDEWDIALAYREYELEQLTERARDREREREYDWNSYRWA